MHERTRRILGGSFGLFMGLLYGLVSQYINVLALPGIPLFEAELGRVESVFLFVLGGLVMGVMVAWPEDAIVGVILGGLVATILHTIVAVRATLAVPGNKDGLGIVLGIVLVIFFLPRAVLMMPISGVLRWVLAKWESELETVYFSIPKLALTVGLLFVLAAMGGLMSLYPKNGRIALRTTHELIQEGMRASNQAGLPERLKPVDGFMQAGIGDYSLLLSDNPDLLPVQRPIADYGGQEYAVLVIFSNGFHFGCAYTPPEMVPFCGNY
jgi:hypothetical protein